jgi:hypothetical protein
VCEYPDARPLEEHLRRYHNSGDIAEILKTRLAGRLNEKEVRFLSHSCSPGFLAHLLAHFTETGLIDFAPPRAVA